MPVLHLLILKEVSKALDRDSQKWMKRGLYTQYSDETRAKIGRHAGEHGIKAAVYKFSRELGKPVKFLCLQAVQGNCNL